MFDINRFFVLVIAFALSACGASSDSEDTASKGDDQEIKDPIVPEARTAVGQFKDSNTAGITYVSGGQVGITDENGNFTYEEGKTVTFSIGGVTIGSSSGKSIVTPIDLVPGGSSNTVQVENIVRFLIMLDSDGDASNGISVSTSVQSIAENWTQVDFTSTDLQTELGSIISDVVSSDGGTHELPAASVARSHLESTLRCTYSGAYKGTFSGDDNGNVGFIIDASNGSLSGVAYSIPYDQFISGSGTSPIGYDQDVEFVSGTTGSGATFSGQFSSVNDMKGLWENSSNGNTFRGEFLASRIGGVPSSLYRFTGSYAGSDYGLFSLDIDASNNVTGIAYSIAVDNLAAVTGTVSGSTITAQTANGSTITGTLNTTSGALDGSWSNSETSLTGTFSGSGCKLN